MNFDLDGDPVLEPSLAEMTTKAMDVLGRNATIHGLRPKDEHPGPVSRFERRQAQRSRRGPAHAASAPGIAMPSTYQTARNGSVDSSQ